MGDAHIVLVEDEPNQRTIYGRWLQLAGWTVTAFEDAESCLESIDSLLPDVVCLDLNLPGMAGHEALERLKAQYPNVPVLVITADAEVDTVVQTMRLGAHDFLAKPLTRARFETQVKNAVLHARLSLRVAQLEREAGPVSYPGIIGTSAAMRQLYRQIDRIASSPVTVLIRGESGSGKELVAQAIHEHSAHSSGSMVAINCAAIPDSLQESELFGHEKGAFTGADSRRIGRFEEADGGTLFLDEVAELSASLQAKLLRVLQERSFRRLGGRRDLTSRFRLIAASHADLHEKVARGSFREDLFYRLAVFELEVPPLRGRLDDLPALAAHFLADRGLAGTDSDLSFSAEALETMAAYDWPGNVRELANAVQRAAVVAAGQQIMAHDLPPRVRSGARPEPVWPVAVSDRTLSIAGLSEERSLEHGGASSDEEQSIRAEASDLDPEASRVSAFFESGPSLEDIESFAIGRALDRHGSNISAVARELGIGRNTLYRKIDRYKLCREGLSSKEKNDAGAS
ncbi:MAG: sigma-54 dependent transcriptional regulator [Holophagales bacterium]|nr:sigma-54 dependent transcriptional regulator [Holophagales bacterium]